jgi:eukaryotic-like serine/threonine-protein kinase
MRYRLARYHDALADFAVARAHAEDTGDTTAVVDLLLDEATALDWMDDFATSQERVLEADRRLPEGAPPLYRARLLLGLGRSATRFSRNDEAADLLQRAALAAEPLGDDGYETRVIALLLLSFILPAISRAEDTRRALEELITLCEAHGDKLHLAGALNTRSMFRGMAGDRVGMAADMERVIAIARELGNTSVELIAEFNFGEFLLLMGDAAAAAPHIDRVRALDLRVTGHPGRAVVALLEARLRLFTGDLEAAAAITRTIRAHQAEVSTRGETDKRISPSDDVLCSAVELSAALVVDERWQALEARSEEVSFGQERIEVVETRAVTLEREGRLDEAREHLGRAVELSDRIPNAMAVRLAARRAKLHGKTD